MATLTRPAGPLQAVNKIEKTATNGRSLNDFISFPVVIALLIPVFFLFLFVSSIYNKLLALRNRVKSAYAELDRQLKRRHQAVLKLLNAAKVATLQHEVFEQLRTIYEAAVVAGEP